MSKELECLDRIDKRNYLTEREHKEFLGVVEKAIKEYESIKNAEPTKAMECLERLGTWELANSCMETVNESDDYDTIKQALQRLEAIDNAKPSKAFETVYNNIDYLISDIVIENDEVNGCLMTIKEQLPTIKQVLLKTQEQEKENELLKEIIKSLFDRGCPLHQYTDKDFGLTIEVDDECSIMHLGEFKGVDLDKKIQEVLENE